MFFSVCARAIIRSRNSSRKILTWAKIAQYLYTRTYTHASRRWTRKQKRTSTKINSRRIRLYILSSPAPFHPFPAIIPFFPPSYCVFLSSMPRIAARSIFRTAFESSSRSSNLNGISYISIYLTVTPSLHPFTGNIPGLNTRRDTRSRNYFNSRRASAYSPDNKARGRIIAEESFRPRVINILLAGSLAAWQANWTFASAASQNRQSPRDQNREVVPALLHAFVLLLMFARELPRTSEFLLS